jgi:hypothetical protein
MENALAFMKKGRAFSNFEKKAGHFQILRKTGHFQIL